MKYIDGFVAAVPTSDIEDYKRYSMSFAPIFREYGALRVVECWGDDVPDGELTSFPMAVKCEANETVVFSWIEWPSRETRMTAWDKMQEDERFNPETNPMPFDGKRMIYGGFDQIVDE